MEVELGETRRQRNGKMRMRRERAVARSWWVESDTTASHT